MKHTVKKPEGTFYWDYNIQDKKCYVIFEKNINRVETVFVCNTNKDNSDWRTFNIEETKEVIIIDLGE